MVENIMECEEKIKTLEKALQESKKILSRHESSPHNDIGQLSREFNVMAETLKGMMAELEIRNACLETEFKDRQQTEQALRDSQQTLTYVLDNFPGVVFWKDLQSTYLGCNKNFSAGAGLADPKEITGKTDYDLPWSETEADAYRLDDRMVMDTGIPRLNIIETQLQTDGSVTWFDTNKTPLYDNEGKVIGVLGASRDITERKRAEEALAIAREELVRKEKLAILGQLAGLVGHEIRNPLGVINNAVYFLKTFIPDADETVKEYLEIIDHEIKNSLHIITDLLDFARTRPPQTRSVDVSSLVKGGAGNGPISDNISIEIDVSESLPRVWVDSIQIEQVLQNLIINAVQAMPGGGTLRFAARQVRGSRIKIQGMNNAGSESDASNHSSECNYVEIIVADTGAGISPENMKKLFQPLFTTKAKGIGLGLVVCKNLTEVNGGKITVESELGRGTTFKMLLPIEGECG